MGILGGEKEQEYPGGNVANKGKTGPDMQIFSPITFRNFEINLEPHNGFTHVLGYLQGIGVDGFGKKESYDNVEKLLVCMQRDGYEILDVKIQDVTVGETYAHRIFNVIVYK